jgi:outer membrane protein assembly factor BamB
LSFLACCLLAGPAAAQLPIFPPPPPPADPGSSVPSTSAPLPVAPGTSTAFGGNASRDGSTPDPRVFGPLKVAWKHIYEGATQEPLVAGGLVIVNNGYSSDSDRPYGNSIRALRPSDGKEVWRQDVRATYFDSALAVSDGVVVAIDNDAGVHAFRLKDGEPLWTAALPGKGFADDAGVVADGGTAYVFARGVVSALDLSTGAYRWEVESPVGDEDGIPAVDGSRVFVTAECDLAAALSRSDGALLWRHGDDESCGLSGEAIYSGGRVFGYGGAVLDAVTGAHLAQLPGQPGAVRGDLAYVGSRAYDVTTGEQLWHARARGAGPRLSGPTAYTMNGDDYGSGLLYGFSSATGKLLSVTKYPALGDAQTGGSRPGFAVGAGHVFIGTGTGVAALAPALRPKPNGVDLLPPRHRDYFAGARFRWIGGVGAKLRLERPKIRLLGDTGRGGSRTLASKRPLPDGGVVLGSVLRRNTRFQLKAGGAKSRSVKLYAYPRVDLKVKRTSARFGVIRVRIGAVPGKAVDGRKIFAYHGVGAKRRFVRLGKARAHGGHASIRFRLLSHVGDHDIVAVCIAGLPRAGYGRNVGLARRCGARRVPYPPRRKHHGGSARPVAGGPEPVREPQPQLPAAEAAR